MTPRSHRPSRSRPARSRLPRWRGRAKPHAELYGHRWRQARAAYLAEHTSCVYCEAAGRYRRSDTVDHIQPHRGDLDLFWGRDNWQALCRSCHDRRKSREEWSGHSDGVDLEGWPVDGRHPVNAALPGPEPSG